MKSQLSIQIGFAISITLSTPAMADQISITTPFGGITTTNSTRSNNIIYVNRNVVNRNVIYPNSSTSVGDLVINGNSSYSGINSPNQVINRYVTYPNNNYQNGFTSISTPIFSNNLNNINTGINSQVINSSVIYPNNLLNNNYNSIITNPLNQINQNRIDRQAIRDVQNVTIINVIQPNPNSFCADKICSSDRNVIYLNGNTRYGSPYRIR